MEKLRFAAAALSFLLGAFFIATGLLGTFRFRFALNRLHSASLIDTLGVFFFTLGVLISTPCSAAWIKLVLMSGFVAVSSPATSHLVSLLEVATDEELALHLECQDKTKEDT